MSVWFSPQIGYMFDLNKGNFSEVQEFVIQNDEKMSEMEGNLYENKDEFKLCFNSDDNRFFFSMKSAGSFSAYAHQIIPAAMMLANNIKDDSRVLNDMERLGFNVDKPKFTVDELMERAEVEFRQLLQDESLPGAFRDPGNWVGPIQFFNTFS